MTGKRQCPSLHHRQGIKRKKRGGVNCGVNSEMMPNLTHFCPIYPTLGKFKVCSFPRKREWSSDFVEKKKKHSV